MSKDPEYRTITIADAANANKNYMEWQSGFNVLVGANGSKRYFHDADLHRIHGPAVIDPYDNTIRWYIHDARYFSNGLLQNASGLSDEEMMEMVLKYGNVR